MSESDLSIVIKCKNDDHVIATIGSIDRPAQVIVALVGDGDLRSRIEACGATVVMAPDNNAGASSQLGLLAARAEKCLLTDSDTVFEAGYIHACMAALDDHDLCRGRIRFLADPSVPGSETVAQVRDYFNNRLRLPYMPGLAVRRSFALAIGGFDQQIRWGIDHEFWLRAEPAGARFAFLDEVAISHLPIPVEHDLKAAFRTGTAMHMYDFGAGISRTLSTRWSRSLLASYLHEPYLRLAAERGFACGLHHLRWIHAFHRGYSHAAA